MLNSKIWTLQNVEHSSHWIWMQEIWCPFELLWKRHKLKLRQNLCLTRLLNVFLIVWKHSSKKKRNLEFQGNFLFLQIFWDELMTMSVNKTISWSMKFEQGLLEHNLKFIVSTGRARPTFHEFHDRVPNSEDTNTTQLGYGLGRSRQCLVLTR